MSNDAEHLDPQSVSYANGISYGLLGLGGLACASTAWQPPGFVVPVNYLSLIAFLAGVVLAVSGFYPRHHTAICWLGAVVSISLAYGYFRLDRYEERWINDRDSFTDSYTRSGQHFYRHIWWKSIGSGLDSDRGPMAGSPPKPHGEWKGFHSLESTTTYYWYGEKVSQGEWHIRNK